MNKTLAQVLRDIRSYHDRLGYPKRNYESTDEQAAQHREIVLAMVMESMEVLGAAPWKPWKNYIGEYGAMTAVEALQVRDSMKKNIAEELVDVLFFIGSICEIWDITPYAFERVFEEKLAINEARIVSGYNKLPQN